MGRCPFLSVYVTTMQNFSDKYLIRCVGNALALVSVSIAPVRGRRTTNHPRNGGVAEAPSPTHISDILLKDVSNMSGGLQLGDSPAVQGRQS